jgi:hypothetical protein
MSNPETRHCHACRGERLVALDTCDRPGVAFCDTCGTYFDDCPAGGRHEWGILEQAGTGRTWAGCENCGTPRPPEEEDQG